MPTAWYQHQTRGPASVWLKLKGLLSSGTRQEFKFSCRGAAGTRNSRDNKDRSPSIDRCHLIGGKPGRCWWHQGWQRLQKGVVFLWIQLQNSGFCAPEPTNPRQSKWTFLPSLFPACAKNVAEASCRDQLGEGHRGAGQRRRAGCSCVEVVFFKYDWCFENVENNYFFPVSLAIIFELPRKLKETWNACVYTN